jgi:hypothetical protein
MILAWLLLLTGLTISAVAIYYSVVGLAAIFSAAVIPIVIMGSALEVGKLVCASWLKDNWERAPRFMKYYMIIAVMVLMLITSMGIFGFLSKAHNDQNLVSGDVQSKIAIYDEKITTEKGNIESAKKALSQMDAQVDQMLGRTDTDKGAERAVVIRKQQAKERANLQAEITKAQTNIASLQAERAPIAAEVRKVEAEVGPIKYIAKFIYGDHGADENMLERAVTWIIILIVVVFDPLAVIMLLAAQMTFGWMREQKEQQEILPVYVADVGEPPSPEELVEDELEGQEQVELERMAALAARDIVEEPTLVKIVDVPGTEQVIQIPPSDKLIWEDSPITPNIDPAAEEAVKWAEENKEQPEAQAAAEWAEEESKKKNYMIKERGKLVIKEQK